MIFSWFVILFEIISSIIAPTGKRIRLFVDSSFIVNYKIFEMAEYLQRVYNFHIAGHFPGQASALTPVSVISFEQFCF